MNLGVPPRSGAPQMNMLSASMSQMGMSSGMPVMQGASRGMGRGLPMPGGMSGMTMVSNMGMMQPRPMGQVQGFGGSNYSTYKGIS